jgi:hypothetical protein
MISVGEKNEILSPDICEKIGLEPSHTNLVQIADSAKKRNLPNHLIRSTGKYFTVLTSWGCVAGIYRLKLFQIVYQQLITNPEVIDDIRLVHFVC